MKIYVIMRASPKGNRLGVLPRGKSGQHRARQSLTATVRKNRESTTETYTAGSLAPITRSCLYVGFVYGIIGVISFYRSLLCVVT